MRPLSLRRCRWRWIVLGLRESLLARVSMRGQHRPVLLLEKSARAAYVGMTSVGTPASTRSLTLGIRVKFDLTATSTSLRSCDGSALVMVRFTNAAGPRPKGDYPAAISM